MKSIYLIGSLRNPDVPKLANELRTQGYSVFDDWHGAGEDADSEWQRYEIARGRRLDEALKGHAAQHIFHFDKKFLDLADIVILLLPAGRSGHLELGYSLGRGKVGLILFDKDPERYDVMYNFADGVYFSKEDLFKRLEEENENLSSGAISTEVRTAGIRINSKNEWD